MLLVLLLEILVIVIDIFLSHETVLGYFYSMELILLFINIIYNH